MKPRGASSLPPARGLAALSRARPPLYSPAVWILLLALDPLPWPWGEEVLARVFVAKAFARVSRLRAALGWAGAHRADPRARWRLALDLCAYHGRFVSRGALLGLRDPEQLRRHLVVHGEEHLEAAPAGRILLGFHLGPPGAALALKVIGHRLTWVGGLGASRAWSRDAWSRFKQPDEFLSLSDGRASWGAVLYRARRMLLDGKTVYMMADGGSGTEAFRVPLPGGPAFIRSGWLTLRRQTGAPVLPVFTHLEGRAQIVRVHPPLPSGEPDPARDLEACRDVLERLLVDYLRRFPEQCYSLAFRPPEDAELLARERGA